MASSRLSLYLPGIEASRRAAKRYRMRAKEMRKEWEKSGKARQTRQLYKKRMRVLQQVKLLRRRVHLIARDVEAEKQQKSDGTPPEESTHSRAEIMKNIRSHKVNTVFNYSHCDLRIINA